MGYNIEDINPKLMGWVGVRPNASLAHNLGYMIVAKKREAFEPIFVNADQFIEGRVKKISSVDTADSSSYRIQDGIVSSTEFLNAIFGGALAITKADIYRDNTALMVENGQV
jgi:hypothetical protein